MKMLFLLLYLSVPSTNQCVDEGYTPDVPMSFPIREEKEREPAGLRKKSSPLPKDPVPPLFYAIRDGDRKLIAKLIEMPGAVKSSDPSGFRPLHAAAMRGETDIVKMLLGAGADPDPVSLEGLTPLHIAAQRNEKGVVKLLIEAGADPERASGDGMTPLHFAAAGQSVDVIKVILNHSNDVDPVTADSLQTPLHLAAFKGNADVVRELLRHGADVSRRTIRGYTAVSFARAAGKREIEKILVIHRRSGH